MAFSKKKKAGAAAGALAGVLCIGGIMAYFSDADIAVNEFTVGKVSLDLQEPNFTPPTDITPGEDITKDPQITNDGVNDEYVYLMVTVPYATVSVVDADGSYDSKQTVGTTAETDGHTSGTAEDDETIVKQINVVQKQYQLFSYTVGDDWTLIPMTTDDNGILLTGDSATSLSSAAARPEVYESRSDVDAASEEKVDSNAYIRVDENDSTRGTVTYLYAYTGGDAAGAMKTLSKDNTTSALFNYVRFANIISDQENKEAGENGTDLNGDGKAAAKYDTDGNVTTPVENSSDLQITIKAYGIQTSDINADTTLGYEQDTDREGVKTAEDVWAVLVNQLPSTVSEATEAENTDKKETI